MAGSLYLKNGLTPKQNAFTKEVLKQIAETGELNLTQAVLKTYNTTNPNSAAVIAHDNLRVLNVRERIEEALNSKGLGLEAIAGNLGELANYKPEKLTGETVLKANIEALKLLGAYPDKKTVHARLDVKAKLKDMKFQDVKEALNSLRSRNDGLVDDLK